MKKTIGMMGGFALSMLFLSVSAQEPVNPPPTTNPTAWDAKKNPTVDSINAKYKNNMVPAREPVTIEKIFPVLGQYQSTINTDAPTVSISIDPENKGVIWVEGVPQGKIKAMLRKSPSTYKIPAQKTEDGKEIPEGTLVFDKEANTLNMVIGTPYNPEDPLAVFNTATTVEQPAQADAKEMKAKTAKSKTKTKTKVKPWTYSGTKVNVETASSVPSNQ
jgi:hypothetical protein